MRKMKLAVVSLLGSAFLGGCLGGWGGGWWDDLFYDMAVYAGQEFLLDNDAVFDLWEDGNVTE